MAQIHSIIWTRAFDVICAPYLPSNDIIDHLARACCTGTRPSFTYFKYRTYSHTECMRKNVNTCDLRDLLPAVVHTKRLQYSQSRRYCSYPNCFLCRRREILLESKSAPDGFVVVGSPGTARKQEAATCFLPCSVNYY